MKKNDRHNDLGFKVPDGYFESSLQKLQQIGGDSSQETEELGFAVPDGYFNDLENNILQQTIDKPVQQLNTDKPAWITPLLAVAAIIVLAIAVNGFWQSAEFTLDDLDNDELLAYIADTDFTDDEEALDILYTGTDILEDASYNDLDQDVLMDYLADEVDLNQMIEE